MSIMGHRVKVLDWSTFRLNLSVTTPYNADFDGDEMNLHLPQTLNAKAEAEQIMMVPRNIVSPQANSPVMGIVQDALLGCSRLTRRDTFVERDVMMNVMMWVGSLGTEHQVPVPMPAVLKPRPLWTGKQVFSLVLPKGCNHRGSSNMKAPPKDELNANDSAVIIQDGQVVTGVIDKRSVGNSAGGLIHVTWLDHGWKETARFMIQVQHIVNYWMLQNSFTISVADTVADTDTLTAIAKEIEVAKGKVRRIVEDAQQGRLEPQPGQTVFSAFEMNVNTLLNSLTERVGEMARNSIDYTNNIVAMILGGSKGNNFNITQVGGCRGGPHLSMGADKWMDGFVAQACCGEVAHHHAVIHKHKQSPPPTDHVLPRPAERGGEAHPLRLRAPLPPALLQGRLRARVARLRRELVPQGPHPAGRLGLEGMSSVLLKLLHA